MKWADALKISKLGRATRKMNNELEPNIILNDPKFPKAPKLFCAYDNWAWKRIPLKEANKYQDWEPEN